MNDSQHMFADLHLDTNEETKRCQIEMMEISFPNVKIHLRSFVTETNRQTDSWS